MTVGKFLCHPEEEDPTQIAFMRIYYQVPVSGTEDANLATLAQQVQPHEVCGELETFRLLMGQGYNSAPRFLGYCQKVQGEQDLVPGGDAKYIIWEKVPGEPLTEEHFWSLDPRVRQDIRVKVRVAFESVYRPKMADRQTANAINREMLCCGVKPQVSRISKIIHDQFTGDVYVKGSTYIGNIDYEVQSHFGVSKGMANP